MSLDNPKVRWGLVVLAVIAVLLAIDAWWVATYRDGFPFDVDEAGYTMIGLIDYFGFKAGGLHGWWEAVQTQTPNAPLMPAMTSIVNLVRPGVLDGFAVLGGFLALLGVACYGIATRLSGPRLGALAAIVAVASPGAFFYSRELIFALPAAAFLACAVYAVIRSEGMQVRGWAIGCGVALGLMVLARTMAVAFAPGVVAAGLLAMIARGGNWRRGMMNTVLLGLAAAATAATWYWRNIDPVMEYLTKFGYGEKSNEFGESHSVISIDWWKAVATRLATGDLLLPLSILIFAALVGLGAIAIKRVYESTDRRRALVSVLGSDVFGVFVVVAAGYLALSTSTNAGNGFTFPLAMLLPPLAVVAIRFCGRLAPPLIAVTLLICVANTVAASTLSDDLSRPRTATVPVLGAIPWVNGTPHAVGAIREQVPGPETHFGKGDRGWTDADKVLAKYFVEDLGTPLVAFAPRNRVVSTNSVGLASLLEFQYGIPLTQLLPEEGDDAATYAAKIEEPDFGLPTALVTTSTEAGDFEPWVTQAKVEAAARATGFAIKRRLTLPDGRELRVWVKRGSPAAKALAHKREVSRSASRVRNAASEP